MPQPKQKQVIRKIDITGRNPTNSSDRFAVKNWHDTYSLEAKMKCPKCQSDNREGLNFCEECGAKFEMECPNCKTKIPITKKFCGECGHMLKPAVIPASKGLSFDEKLKKIQCYLPQG